MIDSIHHLDEKLQFSNIKRYYINTPAINSRWGRNLIKPVKRCVQTNYKDHLKTPLLLKNVTAS